MFGMKSSTDTGFFGRKSANKRIQSSRAAEFNKTEFPARSAQEWGAAKASPRAVYGKAVLDNVKAGNPDNITRAQVWEKVRGNEALKLRGALSAVQNKIGGMTTQPSKKKTPASKKKMVK